MTTALEEACERVGAVARDAGIIAWLYAVRLRPDLPSGLDPGPEARLDAGGTTPNAVASLYKLPLALAWAELVEAGDREAAAVLDLAAEYRSPGPTGVGMLLDDVSLTARDAVRMMLAVSDNACADAVLRHLGRETVNAELARLGLGSTVIRRGSADAIRRVMADTGAASAGEAETLLAGPDEDRGTSQYDPALASASTAQELCRALALVWRRDAEAHRCVREAMSRQAWRHRVASGFPHDDVLVSGKTGTLVRLRHEAAVIEFPHEWPIAVTVLTRAVRSERHLPRVDAAIGELARIAVTPLRRPLD